MSKQYSTHVRLQLPVTAAGTTAEHMDTNKRLLWEPSLLSHLYASSAVSGHGLLVIVKINDLFSSSSRWLSLSLVRKIGNGGWLLFLLDN
jgi:hypothetical protein